MRARWCSSSIQKQTTGMPSSTEPFLKPFKQLSAQLNRLVESRLWLKVLLGLASGIIVGLLLGPDLALLDNQTVEAITTWLALPGQLFLILIQMIVVPLVIASIVLGLAANNNPQALRKTGGLALLFILITTTLAITIGIGLSNLIQPGHFIDARKITVGMQATVTMPTEPYSMPTLTEIPDKVLNLLPKNPMASMVSGEMLQVVLFAAVLGFALMAISSKQARPLYELFSALQEVCIKVVSWAMRLAPLAVFGLITKLVANLGLEVLTGMLMYVLTVIAGLLLMAAFYLLLIRVLGKHSLLDFLRYTRALLLLAFSTSSSAAVMPMSLQTAENVLHIRPDLARFLIPLGATINMAGTALYQGVATVFLAHVFNVDLGTHHYLFIVIMSVAASIGSPATPGAGIVILSMVLEGVGIPAAGVALLLGVDRILDMCRTTINVLGDIVCCSLLDALLPNTHSPTTPLT